MLDWNALWKTHFSDQLFIDSDAPATIQSLSRDVAKLHTLFTRSPDGCPGYPSNVKLRSAYENYYLFVNIPKIIHILDSTVHRFPETTWNVLDVGIGPGTASLAALTHAYRYAHPFVMNIFGTDKSRAFLKTASYHIRRMRKKFGIRGATRLSILDLNEKVVRYPQKFHLVFLCNVLGELKPEIRLAAVQSCLRLMKNNGMLLLMEPALRRTSRVLLEIRDVLAEKQWDIIHPCPGNQPCPALRRPRDWCHQKIRWNPPDFIRRIDRLTGMNKGYLSFSYVCIARRVDKTASVSSAHGERFTTISNLSHRKGFWNIYVCGQGKKYLAILSQANKTPENAAFTSLKRYDRIYLKNIHVKDDKILLQRNSTLTPEKAPGTEA